MSDPPLTPLEALHGAIDACRICEREVGQGYQKIVGLRRGGMAEIVVVGEQPGRREAATALAFAGAAGSVLNRWLIASGADALNPRHGIYFTSLIKCVAPKRQLAFRRMVQNCRPFLARQLETMMPRLVITLGKHAYQWFSEGERTYDEALCQLVQSTVDPLLARFGNQYALMPWPHPSPANNRLVSSAATRRRLEQSFQELRPFFPPGTRR